MSWKALPLWAKWTLIGLILGATFYLTILIWEVSDMTNPIRAIGYLLFDDEFIYFLLFPTILLGYIGTLIQMFKADGSIIKKWYLYLWIILPIVVIASMDCYYGNPLNRPRIAANSCVLFPGLACTDFSIHSDGSIEIDVMNGIGDDMIIDSISLTDDNGCVSENDGMIIQDGKRTVLTFSSCENIEFKDSFCPTKRIGHRFRTNVEITYTLKNSQQQFTKMGALVGNTVR